MTAGIIITIKGDKVNLKMPIKNSNNLELSLLNTYLGICQDELKLMVKQSSGFKREQDGN